MAAARVEALLKRAAMLQKSDIQYKLAMHARVEKQVEDLQSSRDLSHTWIHVDMDAFYAAVEMLENPS